MYFGDLVSSNTIFAWSPSIFEDSGEADREEFSNFGLLLMEV